MAGRATFILAAILLAASCASALGREPAFDEYRAVQDSLQQVEPWFRPKWLSEHGITDYYQQHSFKPESSQGIRCVGRWSFGPSVKVDVRATPDDTIICLARGSGVSLIRFRSHDSLTLDLLSDINCSGVLSRAIIRDTLVYCGMSQGGTGIEVWGVSDPTTPNRLSYVYLPTVMDIAVKDSFLYAIGYQQDSLRIFNVADPRNPVQVGACADSGFSMCASGDYVYLAHQCGLYIVDVSNPANPHRAGSIGGDQALSMAVRDTICFFGTASNGLRIYNVSNPAAPALLGSLPGIQPADLFLPPTCDTVLYSPVFHAINIADLHNPRIIGQVSLPGWDYGVTAVPALNYALVADYFDGLVAVDITSPPAPAIDTFACVAGTTEDICVDQGKAYVAQYNSGLRILDIADPALPRELGAIDSAGRVPTMRAAVAKDSFAFFGWDRPRFRTADVTDPTHPALAGSYEIFNPPEDMVLRDSFVYVAEAARFQIINVARPREPVLVGSCVLPSDVMDLDLEDSLAFVTTLPFSIVNVARPNNPTLVGNSYVDASGVDVVDTIAYVTAPYTGLVALNVARPAQPMTIDSLYLPNWWNDVVVVGTRAYVGGTYIKVVDISDPTNLRVIGSWTPPYLVRRLGYSAPYLYAACYDAGVCVLESTAVGVAEERPAETQAAAGIRGSVVRDELVIELPAAGGDDVMLSAYDVSGRCVEASVLRGQGQNVRYSFARLPAGVYVLHVRCSGQTQSFKVVKL